MPHAVIRLRLPVALTLVLLVAACDTVPTACNEIFRVVTVVVVDSRGAPIVQAGVTSVLIRNDDTLFSSPVGVLVGGNLPILTDQALPHLRRSGDSVAVTVEVPPDSRTTPYFFDSPDGCHINKVTGPDTLIVP